jgi:ABC-2 type transport system ATP-binding protein
MTPSPEDAVVADRLEKRFGSTVALAGPSFSVKPAELFGVVGPDGGGKTTLFRILATLMVPDKGAARVLGRDVVKDLWDLRRRIGYMPGRFSLYPDLSVYENLRFFAPSSARPSNASGRTSRRSTASSNRSRIVALPRCLAA